MNAMMRRCVVTGLLALVCVGVAGVVSAADKPNVILIYTDDQGTLDLNCYGAEDLATPCVDRLAEQGVRFSQMYAPSAICSASRAGLMTGRIPPRAGVPGNVSSMKGHAGMPTDEVTVAEMLKKAGYATAHIGKWHLGYTPETMPNGQGFDYSYGHMGGCIDNYSHFFYWAGPNRHDLWRNGEEIYEDGRYFPEALADECCAFIDNNKDRPFFIYMANNVPHYPLQGTAKWREYYADKDLESPRDMYAAFVSSLDEQIGRVIAKVDELGLREETLIIFQSDHGHSTEERTFYSGGYCGPYRGAKGCLFEGGLRVPSVVSMPGTIPQGVVRDQMAVGTDWLPTIAEFCGVALPEQTIDGRSLKGVILDNAPTPHEAYYWQLGKGGAPQWVVRKGSWKLLGNPADRSNKAPLTADDKLFLVNLADDITEMKNVAKDHPDKVAELLEVKERFATEVNAPRDMPETTLGE